MVEQLLRMNYFNISSIFHTYWEQICTEVNWNTINLKGGYNKAQHQGRKNKQLVWVSAWLVNPKFESTQLFVNVAVQLSWQKISKQVVAEIKQKFHRPFDVQQIEGGQKSDFENKDLRLQNIFGLT